MEGLRHLLSNFGAEIPKTRILIDNRAALNIAACGSTWRTRHFGVRGHRLHEEHSRGSAELLQCPTGAMVADACTQLATAPVFEVLHAAMAGKIPAVPARAVEEPLPGSPGVANSGPAVDKLD